MKLRAAVVKDKKLNVLPKEHIVNKVGKDEGKMGEEEKEEEEEEEGEW